ncbi:MAG: TolC family protein, partial [Planctomycetota bacterium]
QRIPQATSLDDPVVGNTFWPIQDLALQTAGGRVGHQFSFAQNVPWPEKRAARGVIAQREALAAIAEVTKAEREIVESVRLAYYQLWLADRVIEIVEANRDLVQDLVEVAEARFRTGGSQQDVLQAETESDKLQDQLISLRRQKEEARADLGTLVRQPSHLLPDATESLETSEALPDLELLIAVAERSSPSLQGLAAEIARDRAKQTLACLQQYPDFQLGLGYSIVADDRSVLSPVADGHDNINFSIGVTLPVWRAKINGGIREAAHQRSSTIHLREAERDRIRGEIRRLVAAVDAASEQLELFEERLIPRMERSLEIATIDYQGKKAEFSEVIATYQELLNYQIQVARGRATLASTLARIERTVGLDAVSAAR